MLLYIWNIHIHKEGKYNCNLCLCLFSSSNCTGRGRGWPCCVPNYLRTFPKIATETSLRVRLFPLCSCLQICSHSNLLFFPSHTLPLLHFFSSPLLNLFSFFFVGYSLSFCMCTHTHFCCLLGSLCRWCHAGHSEKHRWLHQCKLHQCECVLPRFSSLRQYLCALWVVCFTNPPNTCWNTVVAALVNELTTSALQRNKPKS